MHHAAPHLTVHVGRHGWRRSGSGRVQAWVTGGDDDAAEQASVSIPGLMDVGVVEPELGGGVGGAGAGTRGDLQQSRGRGEGGSAGARGGKDLTEMLTINRIDNNQQ
jgi:hypothetical protein